MSYTDNGTTVGYTYNADGIRTSKTITSGSSTSRHEYILSGSQIVRETVYSGTTEQYTVLYLYDDVGSPIGFRYRTPSYASGVYDDYFFEKNLQGDIIAIYDDTTTKVVTYTYDAWGNTTVEGIQATTIGALNPFRYRGYYYDSEIELYYVNSRYYNAEWGRFLNLDAYITTGQGLISFNMFAYCLNEPVGRIDVGGTASLSCLHSEYDSLDRALIEHGGGGTAYYNYLVRAGVASYEGYQGGYYTDGIPSTYYNAGYYLVPGSVSVVDSMASAISTADNSTRAAFYITPNGEIIPARLSEFNSNLSKLENVNGKYRGKDTQGRVQIRANEIHLDDPSYAGVRDDLHTIPHFHIDRKIAGSWKKTFTGPMEMFYD